MQSIFKTILGILIAVTIAYIGLSLIWANNEAVAADQYLHKIGAEVSSANLRDNVIIACQEQATSNGYEELRYEVFEDANSERKYVVLILKYRYSAGIASLSGPHEKSITVY